MKKLLLLTILILGCTQTPIVEINQPPSEKLNWQNLPLREKIAQMIMVRVRGDFYNSEYWYKKELDRYLEDVGIGGIISFGGSIHGTFHNIQYFQSKSKIPLLVSADYERGLGQWMRGATLFPSNMAVTATNDPQLAYNQGKVTAKEARAIGVHVTFAPVMDVNNNPENPIINFRAYSDSPDLVSQFGTQFIQGSQENGLIACAKHFPGHGNTSTDSHSSLPTIQGNREELEKIELAPFKSAVEAGVKMIMVGHIALPGLDSSGKPASHSSLITTDLLRKEWGFEGIVITDGMEMGGLTQSTWAGESAIRAIEAGSDILLLPMDVDHTIDALELAVQQGRISEDRINESIKRIWEMKTEVGLFNNFQSIWENVENNIGISEHTKVSKEIAEKSITLVKDEQNVLPLHPEKINSLTHLVLSTDDGVRDMLDPIIRDINYTHGNVENIIVNEQLSTIRINEILSKVSNSDHVVVSLLVRIRMDKGQSTIDDSHASLLEQMNEKGIPFVVMSFGSPYLPLYDYLPAYLCAYGYGSISQKAVSDALFGRKSINGILPVVLNNEFKRGHGVTNDKRTKGFKSSTGKYDLNNAWTVLNEAIADSIFPGAQVFISKQGEIVASQGFGYHTYDNQSPPVTPNSIYDIASLTKVVATTPVIMKLISQKKLGLNQNINQFFPNFTGKWKDKVTIEHLLTHSSGLKPFIQYFLDTPLKSPSEIIDDITLHDLDFEPGTQFQYSDLGMILLQEIVKKVGNHDIDWFADRWIYRPLGMQNTMFNPDSSYLPWIVPTEYDSLYRGRLVYGEVHDENAHVLGGVAGHAGLFSNAEDVGKYAQMMLNQGIWLGNRYFWGSDIRRFTKRRNIPNGSERTLGWDTPSRNGKSSAGDYFSHNSYGHLGFTGTSLWIDSINEIIVILLSNRVHPNRNKGGMYTVRRDFHTQVMEVLVNN